MGDRGQTDLKPKSIITCGEPLTQVFAGPRLAELSEDEGGGADDPSGIEVHVMTNYECSGCGKTFSVADWLDSSNVKCPDCGSPGQKKQAPTAPAPAPASSRTVEKESDSAQPASSQTAANAGPAAIPSFGPSRLTNWLAARNKLAVFGIIGALGCLIGAILAEFWLAATYVPVDEGVVQSVCLLIDCSGSMGSGFDPGSNLNEVRAAAKRFVADSPLTRDRIAIVGFGSNVHVESGLSADRNQLLNAIDGLEDGGGTDMASGLCEAHRQLGEESPQRYILLFSDGEPTSPEADTLAAGQQASEQGTKIIAIATDDIQSNYESFLERLTGDPDLVIKTGRGEFGVAFQEAGRKMKSFMDTTPTGASFGWGLMQTGVWTALLAIGIALALIIGQNVYLRRTILDASQGLQGTFGAFAAGAVGGVAGQILFVPFGALSFLEFIGNLFGWTIMGALVGRGMAFFVPNLDRRKAWIGGGAGGAVGAIAFLLAAGLMADVVGRLLGAAILGFAIGLLIALVERFRKVFLRVNFGSTESIEVNLGSNPVTFGGDSRKSTVFAMGQAPVALEYRIEGDQIVCEDVVAETTAVVKPGEKRALGDLEITVVAAS